MPRTTTDLVQAILGDNYGKLLSGVIPDLTPFINAANVVVSKCVSLSATAQGGLFAIADTGVDSQAEIIERWLAAHFYTVMDQIWASKSTGGASASYQGQTQMYLESSKYGQMALRMDMSGSLEALDKRKIAGAAWLGKNAIDQIPIDQRGG